MENVNNTIQAIRLSICKTCPIYSEQYGGVCNKELYLNPNTGDVSKSKKSGYFEGCGCKVKLKVKNSKCPAGKW